MRQTVSQLAHAQHGVLARRQLVELGMTAAMLRTRIANRVLIRLHPGVYALGHRRLRREGHWIAAVLAVGPGAALSHRDAAALHGLRPSNRPRIDVATTRRPRGARAGLELHARTALDPRDRTVVDGIPVTTVARTLVDLAQVVPPDHLAKALREAEHARELDVVEIEQVLWRTRTRHGRGHAAIRAALAEHRSIGTQLTRSVLEDRFLTLIDRHGLPRPRTNIQIEGYEVDALWAEARLVVELDGYEHHAHRHAFQRDREKGNTLTRAGYRLLRFTHDDVVRRAAETAGHIHAALADA